MLLPDMSGPTTAGKGGTTTDAMLAAACLGVDAVAGDIAAVDDVVSRGLVGTIGVKLVEMFMAAGARSILDGSGGTSACHRGGEGLTDISL